MAMVVVMMGFMTFDDLVIITINAKRRHNSHVPVDLGNGSFAVVINSIWGLSRFEI